MKILTGHTSMETAYVVDDYPYGYTLRCKIRYWLEHNGRRGFRLCSQTTNPMKLATAKWNKPKKSTYCQFGVMYLDEQDHVHWSGMSAAYADAEQLANWADKWADGLPATERMVLSKFIAAKLAYEAARAPGDALDVGLAEAREAFFNPPEGE
jgi:hypothetical protein